jgi:fructose-1,6-bisphosphatase/inositol monophosphatase family enzyme
MKHALEPNAAERAALAGFRASASLRRRSGTDDAEWVGFGLRCLLEASRALREQAGALGEAVDLKSDGSPATRIEHEVERAIRARLAAFEPAAAFVGEETGGHLPRAGLAVAVDPVDGTWSFLTESPTWASTLAVFRDARPLAGFVANPATGELAYALVGERTRYLRVSAFGEPDAARTLPGPISREKLLVNLHPSRGAEPVLRALHEAWNKHELSLVRSSGGSPAWGLLQAALGHHVYVNTWSPRPAEPFELVAGGLLVRCAGGDVTDLAGAPIDLERHAGPWLAAIDGEQRRRVAALIRGARPR